MNLFILCSYGGKTTRLQYVLNSSTLDCDEASLDQTFCLGSSSAEPPTFHRSSAFSLTSRGFKSKNLYLLDPTEY
jgi:hypothetical protein